MTENFSREFLSQNNNSVTALSLTAQQNKENALTSTASANNVIFYIYRRKHSSPATINQKNLVELYNAEKIHIKSSHPNPIKQIMKLSTEDFNKFVVVTSIINKELELMISNNWASIINSKNCQN